MQGAGGMGGGIISSALQLIKEKERQADRASERISDGMKTQMELTANQGSWTGGSSAPQKVIKEKVVEKEKVKEPEETTTEEDAPKAPGADEEEQEKDVASMGIFDIAKGASK